MGEDVSKENDGSVLKVVITEPPPREVGSDHSKKPVKGSRVTLHYRGKLRDATSRGGNEEYFDDSWQRGKPLTFTLGIDPGESTRHDTALSPVVCARVGVASLTCCGHRGGGRLQ